VVFPCELQQQQQQQQQQQIAMLSALHADC
jgi:hypothetical protein